MARKWKINLNYSSNDSKWLNNIPRPPCSDSINDNDSQSIVGGSNDAGSVLVTAEKQLELKRKQVMVCIIHILIVIIIIIIINRLWHIVQVKIC